MSEAGDKARAAVAELINAFDQLAKEANQPTMNAESMKPLLDILNQGISALESMKVES